MRRASIAILLAVLSTSCSDFKKGFDEGVTAASSTAPSGASTPTRSTAPKVTPTPDATFRAKPGAPVVYSDGWKVTVVRWEEQATGRFSTPKPGMRFIAVIVRYDNGTPKEAAFNPFDWKLQDSAGVRRDKVVFAGERSDSLSSGQLAPGGFVTGSIQFEVPVGDPKLEMIYAQGFTYKIATWELY